MNNKTPELLLPEELIHKFKGYNRDRQTPLKQLQHPTALTPTHRYAFSFDCALNSNHRRTSSQNNNFRSFRNSFDLSDLSESILTIETFRKQHQMQIQRKKKCIKKKLLKEILVRSEPGNREAIKRILQQICDNSLVRKELLKEAVSGYRVVVIQSSQSAYRLGIYHGDTLEKLKGDRLLPQTLFNQLIKKSYIFDFISNSIKQTRYLKPDAVLLYNQKDSVI